MLQGTAELAKEELKSVYGLRVVKVPLTHGSKRTDHRSRGFYTQQGAQLFLENVLYYENPDYWMHKQEPEARSPRQPVLIGTTSVRASQELAWL